MKQYGIMSARVSGGLLGATLVALGLGCSGYVSGVAESGGSGGESAGAGGQAGGAEEERSPADIPIRADVEAGGIEGRSSPALLQASSGASREHVVAGANHTLFLRADGTVWAWGKNSEGQLATGDTVSPRPTPAQVAGLPAIKAVAAGGSHSLALDVGGHVWAWGLNSSGQLGTRAKGSTPQTTPVQIQIPGSPTIRALAAGLAYSVALDDAGTIWTWGNNAYAQIGNNSSGGEVLTPYAVMVTGGAKAVSAGFYHVLAVSRSGAVWTWGRNNFGQIGDGAGGTTVLRKAPYQVAIDGAVEAVAGGASHSLALLSNGTMRAWGYNGFGQLGLGDTRQQNLPMPVPELAGVTRIAAGQYFSLAMSSSSGTTWSWGQNTFGQLGNGTSPANALSPTVVVGLSGPLDIAAGAYHATALTQECPIWSWGQNIQGQAGLGGLPDDAAHATPAQSEVLRVLYFDGDTDGFGDPWQEVEGCAVDLGWVDNADDCEDFDVVIHPGADEICNGLDENCSGEADESSLDAGGACDTGEPGVCAPGTWTCADGMLACERLVQASPETCDGLDNDCNGTADDDTIDEGGPCQTGARGVCGAGTLACDGGVLACNQNQEPAPEICDGLDNDCNGTTDEGVQHTYCRDHDGDGQGTMSLTAQACAPPSGFVSACADCDDTDASQRPGGTEVCDGKDNDCDGPADEGVQNTYYRDQDGDGHGRASVTTQACSASSGWVSSSTDCDDSNAAVYPGRAERCTDSIDNNCDGRINEGCADPEPDPECTSGTTTSSCYSCAVSRTDSLTGNSDPALQSYDDAAPGLSQIRACPSGYCSCVQRCVGGRWSGCNGGALAPRTGPVPE
ncbi:MopE-related protein [Sorangium sp. So ce118]